MQTCLNLQTLALVTSIVNAAPLQDPVSGLQNALSLKRGTQTPIVGQWINFPYGAGVALGTPLDLRFGCKVLGSEDGSYVVSNYNAGTGLFAYTVSGAGATSLYTVQPSWNTAKLNNLLGYDPDGFAEETEIRTVADLAGSLDGKCFQLTDHAGSVGVWIALNNGATAEPAGATACARAVKVTTINTGDSATVVAAKLASALAADAQFTASFSFANVCTAVDTVIGPRAAAAALTSGFELSEWIAGSLPETMVNQESVDLEAEWYWSENGVVSKSQTFTVRVYFDINNGGGTSPSADPDYPAPGLLLTTSAAGAGFANGAQNGRTAIGNAAQTVVVVFANAFAAAAQLIGIPCVEKAADGDDDVFCTGVSSLTAAGFTAHLSAPTGNANYHLHWYAFFPSA